ncbi:MAG: hypothetical protein ABI434_18885 [Burkholderiaceae bacterium]
MLSLAFIGAVLGTSAILRWVVWFAMKGSNLACVRTEFWTKQGVSLFATVVLLIGLRSIWCNDPTNLPKAFGLMSAGLAFALQQVITSIAGHFVVLRGSTFTVGDRISMGVPGPVRAQDGAKNQAAQIGFRHLVTSLGQRWLASVHAQPNPKTLRMTYCDICARSGRRTMSA